MAHGDRNDQGRSGEVLDIPLESLQIDMKVRRRLSKAGIGTLGEAFAMTEGQLDELLGYDITDQVLSLQRRFERDPASLLAPTQKVRVNPASRAFTSPPRGASALAAAFVPAIPSADEVIANQVRAAAPAGPHPARAARSRNCLPDCAASIWLGHFDMEAAHAIDVVADHANDAFLAEALGMVSDSLPNLRQNVKAVVDIECGRTRGSASDAIRALEDDVPDAFLLYLIDAAQRNFTGSSVWTGIYEELGIGDNNSEIPRFAYEAIGSKGFATYEDDETKLLYYYTILLHAGLAQSDWESIWEQLLLPLARDMRDGKLPDGFYPTPDGLIDLATRSGSPYCLRDKTAENLLAKASEATGPLLAEGLAVAESLGSDFCGRLGAGDGTFVTTGEGLSPRAMDALEQVLASEQQGASTSRGGRGAGRRETSQGSRRVVYIRKGELRLDLTADDKPLCVHWDRTRFPKEYAGGTVIYKVNGEELGRREVHMGVDSATLEQVEIHLAPARTFDIEVELSWGKGERRKRLYASQSFRMNKPGAYEFVMTSDGVLRQRAHALRKRRDVWYLVKEGLDIKPGEGMALQNETSLDCGYVIQCYEVDPMGWGELVERASGERVAAWCEGFGVTIEEDARNRVIGEAPGGIDLYPFVGDRRAIRGGYNRALPAILIESFVDGFDRSKLEVECLCDGHRVYVDQRDIDVRRNGSHVRGVVLRLAQSSIPAFVREAVLTVRYRPTGGVVLSYRFAVAPVRSVTLAGTPLVVSSDDMLVRYELDIARPCVIARGDGEVRVGPGEPYCQSAWLSEGWMTLRLRSLPEDDAPEDATQPATEVVAQLFLAGVKVAGPRVLDRGGRIAADRHDIQEACSDERLVRVTCEGRRANRGIYLALGAKPCLYKMLPVASSYVVDPFDPLPSADCQGGDETACPRDLRLVVHFSSGWRDHGKALEKSLDASLGKVVPGYGFGSCDIVETPDGLALMLDKPVAYDLVTHFARCKDDQGSQLCEDVPIKAGQTQTLLPRKAARRLVTSKPLMVTFAITDPFGNPDLDQGQVITFEGKRIGRTEG